MHMRVVPFIMKGCVPPKICAVNFHIFTEHRAFGTQQCHPLSGAVVAKPGSVLPPQGYDMRPDRAFMGCHIFLHLADHYRCSCVRKQTMLSDSFYAGPVRDIVHIIFPFSQQIQVLLQGAGDKFRSVLHGGFS